MNSAVLDFTHTEPPMGDPVDRPSAQRWSMTQKVLMAILAIGTVWGLIVTTQFSTAMQRAGELESRNAALDRTNRDLAAQVKTLPTLRQDLADTKRSLDLEITQKRRLAVMYERAEAGRKQAVADHATALGRIAALEKVGAGKKPQPKRK